VEAADSLARVFHTQVAADGSRRCLRCGKNAPIAGGVAQTDRREGQPGGLADGSRWSFGAKGERPPGSRVGWPSTPEGCQTQPELLRLGPFESAPQRQVWHPCRGAGHLPRCYPEVAAPQTSATSGYPLATLQVGQSRVSELHGALDTAPFKWVGDLSNTPCRRRRRRFGGSCDVQSIRVGA